MNKFISFLSDIFVIINLASAIGIAGKVISDIAKVAFGKVKRFS